MRLSPLSSRAPCRRFSYPVLYREGGNCTLPASLSPLLSDGPIALLVLFLLNRISTEMLGILQVAGGILLLYFAWAGYRQWKQCAETDRNTHGKMPRTFIQAAMINILNPNPYLGWSLGTWTCFFKCMASTHAECCSSYCCLLYNDGHFPGQYHILFRSYTLSIAKGKARSHSCVGRYTCSNGCLSTCIVYFKIRVRLIMMLPIL